MAKSIHLAADTVDEQATAGGTIYGYSIRETAGAVASVVLRHGTEDTDPPVAFIDLAADGAAVVPLPALDLPDGLFIERAAGSTELVIYTS